MTGSRPNQAGGTAGALRQRPGANPIPADGVCRRCNKVRKRNKAKRRSGSLSERFSDFWARTWTLLIWFYVTAFCLLAFFFLPWLLDS